MMNAILSPPLPAPARPRLWTIEDVSVLPGSLPTGDVKYELDDGRLVTMAPPGEIHSAGQSNFVTELKIQGERGGHGIARAEVGVILRRNPDRLVGPDAVFIATRSLPVRRSKEGYLETIPELVVEVRSKNDGQPEVDEKVSEYLAAGVVVVWVADPAKRTVVEYRAGQEPRRWESTETLAVPDVIPGFQVMVKTLFD